MAGWTTLARERADRLGQELENVRVPVDQRARLREHLAATRRDHIESRKGVRDWITGNAVNETWSELHWIEEQIDEFKSANVLVDHAVLEITAELPPKRAKEIKDDLIHERSVPERKREAIAAIHEAHRAAEKRHDAERSQQRGMVAISAALFVAALIVVVLQATVIDDEIIPSPSGGMRMSASAMLSLVMLLGMVGGALSALLTLYVGTKKYSDTLWFDPRPGLVVVKVVLGLWTAVLGLLVVSTGEIVGIYTSLASAFLLALMFGYSQHAVTTFVDRRVTGLLQNPKSANE